MHQKMPRVAAAGPGAIALGRRPHAPTAHTAEHPHDPPEAAREAQKPYAHPAHTRPDNVVSGNVVQVVADGVQGRRIASRPAELPW